MDSTYRSPGVYRFIGYVTCDTCIVGGVVVRDIGYRNVHELVAVVDASGEKINVCATKGQYFMTLDGQYKKMRDIRVGDKLCLTNKRCGVVKAIVFKGYMHVSIVQSRDTKCYFANEFICANYLKRSIEQPQTSYGIIAFRHNPTDTSRIQLLMIRRKFTMGFMDLIRGQYYNNDVLSVTRTYLAETTKDERVWLSTIPFENLWNFIWTHQTFGPVSTKEFNKAKKRFYLLPLKQLITEIPCSYEIPEYGFPKGRKNHTEDNIVCAKREFEEETGLSSHQYYLLNNVPPLEERFVATNGVTYKHVYFLAQVHQDIPDPVVDYVNHPTQLEEIGAVEWHDSMDCKNLLRPYDYKKKKVVDEVNVLLQRFMRLPLL